MRNMKQFLIKFQLNFWYPPTIPNEYKLFQLNFPIFIFILNTFLFEINQHNIPNKMIFYINLFQFILLTPMIFLQCSTIIIFLWQKEYRTNLAFILMLSIAVSDLLCAFDFFANLFCYLFGLELPEKINRILNAIEMVGFDHGTVHLTLLALNRFITVLRMYRRPSGPSAPKPLEFGIFITISAVCWIFYLIVIILFQTPLMGMKYDLTLQNVGYNYSFPYSNLYSQIDYSLTILCPILIFLLYVGIVFILRKNRTRVITTVSNAQKSLLNQYESRILLQSFISFVYYAIAELIFLYIDYFQIETGWIISLKNCIYTIYYGFNPCVYLTTNSEFRQFFLQLFSFKRCNDKNKSKNVVLVNHVQNVMPMKRGSYGMQIPA